LHIAKVDDYITKPFGPSELLSSVLRVLEEVGIEAQEASGH
jgi:DNA-binding response OmpR family regulator